MTTFVVLDRGLKDNIKAACFDLALLRLSDVLKQAIGIDDTPAVPVTSETTGRRRGPSVTGAVPPPTAPGGAMPHLPDSWTTSAAANIKEADGARHKDVTLDIQRKDA